MATKEATVDAFKDDDGGGGASDLGGGVADLGGGAQIRAATAADLGADAADRGGATGRGQDVLVEAGGAADAADRGSATGRGQDVLTAADADTKSKNMDWKKAAAEFLEGYYKTLENAPKDLHKFYHKRCQVTWTILDDFYHMKRAEEIEKMMAAPNYKHAHFTKNQYAVQVLKKHIHIAVSGIHKSNMSSNFMQTLLVHCEKRRILSDILIVVPDVAQVPFDLRNSMKIGSENNANDKSSAARTRIYVKRSIPALSHESQSRKPVAILCDERMMNHKPDYYCLDGDIRMIKHKDPSETAIELPERISSIMKRLYADKLMDRAALVEVNFASLDDVLAVHDADYVDFIHSLPPNLADFEKYHGYSSSDMFCSEGTRDAVFLAAGAAIKAAELVYTGHYEKAFAVIRPPGHHAGKGVAEGFCYSNNLAIAAQNLIRKHGAKKIAAVDWDVHHGNGTQELFYSSDEVLFFSSFNKSLGYPKTMNQRVEDIGNGKGAGYNVNVPLRTNFGDSDMLYVWNELLLPLLEEFQAEIILVSCGYDAAQGDVGRANVTPPCYGTLLDKLIKCGNGKVVLILEGGYELPILSECAAQCVQVLTGDSKACLKEDKAVPLPPKGTRDTVDKLKRLLSRKWKAFKAQGY